MAEGAESITASTTVADATVETAAADVTSAEDKTATADASTDIKLPAAEKQNANEAEAEGATNPSAGEKRKVDSDDKAKADDSSATKSDNKPKKAKIAMPPKVSSSLMDVEKYKLEVPPPEDNTNEADVTKKITTANLMLFGLHPLIREGPLKKMLEDYGTVQAITVRSAFASRYGHVSFATVEEAQKCYVAIHGAKLLHKTFLVQPSMASPAPPKKETASKAPVATSAGAAALAAVAASTKSNAAPASSEAVTTSSA
jgi:hypothetical protein|mmetsp:Transcript_15857/g.32789  ORF Transcript_15857/g.32789 Transcript_15857/m.32789 type:complete len:258 (+) Transcript_15857:127-900(+)